MTPPTSSVPSALDRIHTVAVHAGTDPDAYLGALSPPLFPASVYAYPDAETGAAIHEGEAPGFSYGRMGTPTQALLESALAEIEGVDTDRPVAALALASGMAAISSALLALTEPGGHAVAPRSMYATASGFLDGLLARAGVSVTYVDAAEPGAYATAVRDETQVLYVETPSNPVLTVTDLDEVVQVARQCGAVTVADNTFATPVNQRPLAHGIDVVVHSATKYLGGHGDLVAGAIVGPPDVVERARWQVNKYLGAVVAPWTAWLVLRGLRTLPLRVERHNANALAVAQALEAHPAAHAVHYPGLASHPQHALARRQMRGFGGMVAFDVGSVEAGRRLADGVRLCSLAVSLGDVATLVQHSASMSHASVAPEVRREAGITDGLLRLSVGVERAEDVIADLTQALSS